MNVLQKASGFYEEYVQGDMDKINARTAHMCKLAENSSRDVQIAIAIKLSLICDKAEIDSWVLISSANKHPGVNILNPGCGLGRHCIAVVTYLGIITASM